MDIKETLRAARRARTLYETARRRERELEEQRIFLHATDYEAIHVSSSGEGRTVENLALQNDRAHRDSLKRLRQLQRRLETAQRLIDSLDNEQWADVLTRYYLLGDTWEEVAAGAGYSVRQVYRIHGDALEWLRRH